MQNDDEAFWRGQEKRREKQLGQPCCTQSGMSWTMIDMPGNFAVVIHGEYDCVNCFHHHTGRSTHNYYSTRLTEEMLTTGRTEAQLRRCLELIATEQRPEVVIVLGTCPVEVIGDRFGPVVEEVSARTGIPMIPLRTSGLALSSQQHMLDWLFVTLASLPEGPPVDRRWQAQAARLAMEVLFEHHAGSTAPEGIVERLHAIRVPSRTSPERINLIGLPGASGQIPEPVLLLGDAGIEVNACYPEGASVSEWRAIRHASHAVAVDRSMYPRFLATLSTFGQTITEVPLPVGLGPSRALYAAIGALLGRAAAIEAAIAPLVALAEPKVASFRVAHAGRKVAVAIRMLNNYRTDALAYDGLGELAALAELGLEVELLVQGPPEESAQARVGEKLAARGCALPFRAFPGPYALADVLREGHYDLCIVSDSSRDAAHAASVPMLSTRALGPFLSAVPANVDLLARTLGPRR